MPNHEKRDAGKQTAIKKISMSAVTFSIVKNVPTFTFHFEKIDLVKCKQAGLEFLMELALHYEDYHKAAKIKDEMDRRKISFLNSSKGEPK